MTASDLDDESDWHRWRSEWSIAEGVTYLNNGSFGPTPRAVSTARRAWLDQVESDPHDFLVRQLGPALANCRRRLAGFVDTTADNLALVENASVAMNIVASSVQLEP